MTVSQYLCNNLTYLAPLSARIHPPSWHRHEKTSPAPMQNIPSISPIGIIIALIFQFVGPLVRSTESGKKILATTGYHSIFNMCATLFSLFSHRNRLARRAARYRRIACLTLLVWFSWNTGLAWSASLSQVLSAAISRSPVVQTAEKQRSVAEQQTKQALAGYWPSIELSTTIGQEQTDSPSTRSTGKGAVTLPRRETRTTLNQMLFDGFNVSNEVKKARALQKAAEWGYQMAVQTIRMDTIEQFLEVQKQRELLYEIKQFAHVQAEFLGKVEEWYQGGAGTVAEVWQTESRLALTQSSMATVESKLSTAMDVLAQLIGFMPDQLEPVLSASIHLPHSLQEALTLATQHHPSLLEAQSSLEAAEATRAASHSRLWPSIQLAVENSRTNNPNGFEGDTEINSAMVRMSYNLFRGGSDLARKQEFSSRLEQAESQAAQVKQTVQKNTEKSWRVISELRQRLTALKHHETVSKQVAGAYHEQFIADQRSLLDVLNAENELFTANSNRISGYYALLLEEYRLLANIGLLERATTPITDKSIAKKTAAQPSIAQAPAAKTPVAKTPVAQPPTRNVSDDAEPMTESAVSEELIAEASVTSVSTDENRPAWLTSSTPIILYDAPHKKGMVVKRLPEQTPIRTLQTRKAWVEVISEAGDQGWMESLSSPDGPIESGMFTLTESTNTSPD